MRLTVRHMSAPKRGDGPPVLRQLDGMMRKTSGRYSLLSTRARQQTTPAEKPKKPVKKSAWNPRLNSAKQAQDKGLNQEQSP